MLSERQIKANCYALSFSLKLEAWVQKNLYADFTLRTKLDWNPARKNHRGGIYKDGPGISIAMYWAMPTNNDEVYKFHEYASYDTDKHIGGFYATDPYLRLEACIAHEVAHAVQFFSYTKTNTRCSPHGPVFKHYYKLLRQTFINARIPVQEPLKQEYTNYVNSITSAYGVRLISLLN